MSVVTASALLSTHVGASPLSSFHAARADEMIRRLDLDDARKELVQGDENDPAIQAARGRLALYEADCDGAVISLSAAADPNDEDGATLLDIAKGCARVTAATVKDDDHAHDIVVRYQDELDRPLGPLIVDTVVKARESISRDLGVTWPKPTRIIVVRDLLSLSAMTGLPYDAAQTTGTVAVAKWGRVTILSPRASQHGYAWRDTLAHELTHLAVTRLSADRAPLWLQEGLAKREEVRWRDPAPFDDRPSYDSIVRRGIDKKIDLPLDKLGPSIAMLPSAEQAMVAFAEVTSFVRYFAKTAGDESVKKLLAELRDRKTVDQGLVSASAVDLKGWDVKWRAEIANVVSEQMPGLDREATDPKTLSVARDRIRLAELLFGRDHAAEAQKEIDPIKGSALVAHDPGFAYLEGRTLEANGALDSARSKVQDPASVVRSHAPWWALRGRLANNGGDPSLAVPSFAEAVGEDPFSVESTCQSLDPKLTPPDPILHGLCEASRARAEPDLGRN